MNKTLTINLNKIVYHIDEDAYQLLNDYLESLTKQFEHEEGANEIMEDIESRIAELFTERLRFGMQVISLREVNEVIAIMGQPEDFEPTEEPTPQDETDDEPTPEPTERVERKLFRDPEDRVLGGVASGIAHYISSEVVWVRLVLFILLFAWGMSFWIYICLWLVVPEAKTAAQRLQMMGEPTTAENIKNKIMDEAKRGIGNTQSRLGDVILEILRIVVKVIFALIIAGFVISLLAMILPFLMVMGITGLTIAPMGGLYPEIVANGLQPLALISIALAVGIPLFAGIRYLLARILTWRPLHKGASITLILLWAIGVALLLYTLFHSLPLQFPFNHTIHYHSIY